MTKPHLRPSRTRRWAAACLFLAAATLGCDRSEDANVPEGAGKGLAPAEWVDDPQRTEIPTDEDPVAWVGDAVVSRAAVEAEIARVRAHFAQRRSSLTPETLEIHRSRVIEELIDRELLRAELADEVAQIPESAVDRLIDDEVSRIYGSVENLERHLREHGSTSSEHRSQVRLELALRERYATQVEPPPEAVEQLYRRITRRAATQDRLEVISVLFDRSTERAEVESSIAGVRDAEDFRALASAPRRLLIADTWVERDAFEPRLAAALFSVTIPGISAPIETPAGYQVYWVSERSVETSQHFRELEPLLRERVVAMRLSDARRALVASLREKVDVRRAKDPAKR